MKKMVSILLSICIFAAMAMPVFATNNAEITVDMNGGGIKDLCYVIPDVIETKSYATDGSFDSIGWNALEKDGLVTYIIKSGTTIDLSGLYVHGCLQLKLVNGVLSQTEEIDWDKMIKYSLSTEYDSDMDVELFVEGSYVQFNTPGFYAFYAVPFYPLDGAAEIATVVLYVTEDGSAPKDNTDKVIKPVTQPTSPISAIEGTSYTVKAGDTLGLLSLNNYGSYDYHTALYKANAEVLKKSGGKIYKGLVISIPTTIAKGVNAIAPAILGEGEKLYTVKSGDTLGTIALATYKDMSKYKAIFERNTDRLANANKIYAGQVIVLPAK